MRMMMKVMLDTAKTNELAKQGRIGSTIASILELQRPEASYFVAERGKRCGFLFVDFTDPSELPRFAEPWFLAFNAKVEVQPAMTVADLQKAGPDIQAAGKQFG